MDKSESAVKCFRETFSCAQAVFSAYAPELGLDRETALKVAGAFGGGMARMGETCGAVTGAFMALGLKHGKTKAEDDASKEKTYSLVLEFVDKFKSRNNSISCRELLGFAIGTPEGARLFKEKKAIETVCSKLVKDAAEIVEELLKKS